MNCPRCGEPCATLEEYADHAHDFHQVLAEQANDEWDAGRIAQRKDLVAARAKASAPAAAAQAVRVIEKPAEGKTVRLRVPVEPAGGGHPHPCGMCGKTWDHGLIGCRVAGRPLNCRECSRTAGEKGLATKRETATLAPPRPERPSPQLPAGPPTTPPRPPHVDGRPATATDLPALRQRLGLTASEPTPAPLLKALGLARDPTPKPPAPPAPRKEPPMATTCSRCGKPGHNARTCSTTKTAPARAAKAEQRAAATPPPAENGGPPPATPPPTEPPSPTMVLLIIQNRRRETDTGLRDARVLVHRLEVRAQELADLEAEIGAALS